MFECESETPCSEVGYYEFDTLVLSGGKTGSTTLYKSLGKRSLHCHNWAYWKTYLKTKGTQKCFNCTCRFNANRLSKKGKELFIFSAFRDPIARSLSSFFQNKEKNSVAIGLKSCQSAGIGKGKGKAEQLSVKECEMISRYAIQHLENYDPLIEIFREMETRPLTLKLHGGKQVVLNPHQGMRIIVLSFKNISQWGKIVPDIAKRFSKGAGAFNYRPCNLTSRKSHYSHYKQVMDYAQNRFSLLELRIKMNQYQKIVDFFWSTEQKKQFILQWCNTPQLPFNALFNAPLNALGLCEDVKKFLAFDCEFYRVKYPDVVKVHGSDEESLLTHFLKYGVQEERFPNPGGPLVLDALPAKVRKNLLLFQ